MIYVLLSNFILMKRRTFLDFLMKGAAASILPLHLVGCDDPNVLSKYKGLLPMRTDQLNLIEGVSMQILLKRGDEFGKQLFFGSNNDYTAMLPMSPNRYMLWVNHEYLNPLFVHKKFVSAEKTKKEVEIEMKEVGGSLIEIERLDSGELKVVQDSIYNRKIDGLTSIPFANQINILDQDSALGTLANCAGGKTPWGTFLTCEENYDGFYGERDYKTGNRIPSEHYGWENHFDCPPEHYGWVVEINPKSGEAQKLTALGRCAHECATVFQLEDGRCVVYTGDDANDEHLYKFISKRPNDLSEGTLYVANLKLNLWIPIDIEKQDILKANFSNQLEVLIRLREAAKLVGATPLDRPEDIEIDPITGHVLIALTNNKPKGNFMGSILKLISDDNNHESLSFSHETFLAGGEETGFACPDNLVFDPKGNLWFTTDISGSAIGSEPYKAFGNNALFVVPRFGERAGEILRIASAPMDAELTGVSFVPDSNELLVCVQHPGEESKDLDNLTSNWPEGKKGVVPKSAVVILSGEFFDDLWSISMR
jgi:secreted PhoX family phosphatase